MNIKIRIECECKSFADIPLTLPVEDECLYLSQGIEQNSKGLFYCLQNSHDGLVINCVMCGNEITVAY